MTGRIRHALCASLAATWLFGPGALNAAPDPAGAGLDALAERYVRLVLEIGEHDADFVDAYYGPPEWREAARARKRPLAALDDDARQLAVQIERAPADDEMSARRRRSLLEQMSSIRTRLAILRGDKLSFDEEARRIYGVSPPRHDDDFYRAIAHDLDGLLPGPGPLRDRMDAFKKEFLVAPDRVGAGLEVALAQCRDATLAQAALPASEEFRLELVADKPWQAYNWYQGHYRSVIQYNVSPPVYGSGFVGTMCHEGYPGHHVLNTLLEEHLVDGRGWVEYTVYPLFSAESLLAESSANFGIDLVFPGNTRWQWERDHLYPVVGIDPARAELQFRVSEAMKSLAYAQIDAARAYLDGGRSAEQTISWLQEFTFATRAEAERRLRFFDTYRSYIVNYRLGDDLVREYVDRVGGQDPEARWKAFIGLISSPPVVSDLARGTALDPARQ